MPYSVGDIVENFSLPTANGADYSLDAAAHLGTLVVWTCNHCPYALAWHGRIQAVARDYASRGIGVIQINANDADKYPLDSLEHMQNRVSNEEFDSPYARDEDQQVSKRWGAKVTPDVFILDSTGKVIYRGAPDADHDDPSQNAGYIRDALDDLLAGKRIRVPETNSRGCSVKWIINDQPDPYV